MARNTPVPLRIVQGPAASLANIVFPQGELIFDTTNKRLLVGDGLTLGGIPVAGDSAAMGAILARLTAVETVANNALPKAGGNMTGVITRDTNIDHEVTPDSNQIEYFGIIKDGSGTSISAFGAHHRKDGSSHSTIEALRVIGGKQYSTSLSVGFDEDGRAYAIIPTPDITAVYPKSVAITKEFANLYLVGMAPEQIHVGGANASDTADLGEGRGYSTSLPFATPEAAIAWATSNLMSPKSVTLVLHDDFTFRPQVNCGSFRNLFITSDSTKRTITLTNFAGCYSGCLTFSNIKLAIPSGSNVSCFACADGYLGYSMVRFDQNVEFLGNPSSASLIAYNGGKISVRSPISGTVESKRFSITRGGLLILNGQAETVIPGNAAGTHDDSSFVV